jgi:hypothetical protein
LNGLKDADQGEPSIRQAFQELHAMRVLLDPIPIRRYNWASGRLKARTRSESNSGIVYGYT